MNKVNYHFSHSVVEKELMEIWQRVFKRQKIGVDDNFFELGGNFLLATEIISLVNVLGHRLQIKDLFYYQTIAAISKKLVSDEVYIIPVNKEGKMPPIFIIDDYWVYAGLIFCLGKNQPLYFLTGAKLDRLEDVVSFYIRKIKTVQPTGPYYIGGFCGNGYVALKIADRLTADGLEVGQVFLFETYAWAGIIGRLSLTYARRSYKKLLNLPSPDRQKFLRDEIRQAAKSVLLLVVKLLTKRHLEKTNSGRFALRKPLLMNFSCSYPVVLFMASEPPIWAKEEDYTMGWNKLFYGKTQTFIIPGNHLGIFRTPGVSTLAEAMKKIMENAEM